MAVASRGGMVKVVGGPGVELVLEEEGASVAGEDPPAHLLFPTPDLLVGVTSTGAVLSWDLAAGGRGGNIPSPLDPATGLEERVTSVHSAAAPAPASPEAQPERYIFTGFESGRVRIAQVLPVCRLSGYTVEPRDTSSGAPKELLAPGDEESGQSLGAVTSITSFGDRDGGAGGGFGVFGYRYGGIVIWDWVRRKRLALRSLAPPPSSQAEAGQSLGSLEDGDGQDPEVTSLAVHPSGQVFAAGFASGCYALFSASSSSHEASPSRWVHEVGDDGSCPREGPTVVRTAVSMVQWMAVRGAGAGGAWGLVVAGGVEMEEGEEPDGVSLLVPHSSAPDGSGGGGGGGGGGRAKKKEIIGAAMAELETAVFVPFAMGQERLSHVHCVVAGVEEGVAGAAPSGVPHGEATLDGTEGGVQEEQEAAVDVSKELVIMGLVRWNEEVRGDDGRLHFRLASSIMACPVQVSPYVALLQLAPERFGPYIGGFAAVTAVASTPLLSSCTILDFVSCLGDDRAVERKTTGGSPALSRLLRGGQLRWPESVPPRARDEALCTSELLVVGHSDGLLTLWECCGPASRQDAVSIAEGRVVMREVPSGAVLLGAVPVAELGGNEEGGPGASVSALDVWIERDHVAAAERNACWVAVGFDGGHATVIVLSNRMDAGVGRGFGGSGSGSDAGGGKEGSRGGTPLAEKPVEVSDVQLSDGTIEDSVGSSSGGGGSGGGGGSLLKRFVKRGGGQKQPSLADEEAGVMEDDELEVAIAEARAEARAIAELEESTGEVPGKGEPEEREADKEKAKAKEKEGRGPEKQESNSSLRRELSEAMAEEQGTWDGSAAMPSPPRPPPTDVVTEGDAGQGGGGGGGGAAEEEKGNKEEQGLHLDMPRKASLVQLSLRLHSLSVRCVALSFDSRASALALVVADAGGVVSVTDVSTGSASLLPMRVPQSRPCHPSVAIGPLPRALSGGRAPQLGVSGTLFVLLEGWLNVFDLASRDPVDFVRVPGFASPDDDSGGGDAFARPGGGTSRRSLSEEKSRIACVGERGLPLLPYASESFSSSLSPPPAASGGGVDGTEEPRPEAPPPAKTIWVPPPTSRTALDDNHEHELQLLSDSPPPEPLLLVVRGGMAVVLAVAEKEAESVSSVFSRRSQPSPDASAFKGRPGAELVVRSRASLPRAEGEALPPTVDGAGVCLVPVGNGAGGEVARRGCLVAADSSGYATGLLLPSLCPVFRDRLPPGGGVAGSHGGASMAQKSLCNFCGELTLQGTAGVSWCIVVH